MLYTHMTEAKYDLLSLLRSPGFYLPAFLFPTVFYYFFGVAFPFSAGGAQYSMVAYACFGVIGPALFNFAIAVAGDREHGWLALKRVAPMPFSAYLLAKLSSSLFFGMIIICLLFAMGVTFAGVTMPRSSWLLMTVVLLLGTLPFALLGLLIGLLCSDKAAPAIVNLIYLPMAFLAGLWIPLIYLPGYIQTVAFYLPTYHFSQLAFKIIDADQGHAWWLHLGYLIVLSAVLAGIARWRFAAMAR